MSKKFTELNAGTIGAGSIFAQAQEPALSGDPYTSTKVSATQIANYVAKGQAFPELNNQTLIQALTGGSGAGTVILTMAQYIALTPAQQTDGHIYVISDFACIFCYGRQYRAMQKLTQAQYNQLSSAEQNNGTLYVITDEETTAADIPYSAGVSVADKLGEVKIDKLTFNTAINTTMGSFYRSAFITVDITSYGFTAPPKIFMQPLSENAYPIGVLVLAQSITATSFQFAFVSGQSSTADDVETFIFMYGN